MSYIRTYSWKMMDPFNPDPTQIVIEDIAHSLSMICRFAGHANRFYSVAEHCCHVCDLSDQKDMLAGLMHDASEAYLIDLPRPIKHARQMHGYRVAEDNLMKILSGIFGFDYPLPASVIRADSIMLNVEQPALFNGNIDLPKCSYDIPDMDLNFWPPESAERAFLFRFSLLQQG